MTIFAIIEPRLRQIRTGDFIDYKGAVIAAGLKLGELDFGTVASWPDGRTLSIIVYEYGLMKDKSDPQGYFGFNKCLFNGNAVFMTSPSRSGTPRTRTD